MDLIPNDRKHLLRTETFHKYLLKTFYYDNKDTREVKIFQKLSDKEIYFTLQSNSTKYKKHFKFIYGQTSLMNTIFSFLKFGVQLLLIGLRNALMDIYFLTLQ